MVRSRTTHSEGRWDKVGVVQAVVGFPFDVVWAEERIGRDVVFYFSVSTVEDDGRIPAVGRMCFEELVGDVFVDGVIVRCFLADLSAAEVVVLLHLQVGADAG